MGTIIGILFIAGLLYVGAQTVKEGTNAMSEGSGCGCIFGVFMILFGLGLISTGLGAPIGIIIIALIVIAIATDKK